MMILKKFNLSLILLSLIVFLGYSFLLIGNSTTIKDQNDFNLLYNSNSASTTSQILWNFSLGENEYVEAVAISSDGAYITAACNSLVDGNGMMYLFNNSLSGIKNLLWNYSIINPLYSIDISANGSNIVVGGGSDDKRVYFFDYLNPIPLWNYSTGEWVYDVWISNDGYYIAAASGSNKAFLFNRTGPSPFWEVSTAGLALRVEASSNASLIAVTDNAYNLYLFNKSTTIPEWTFPFSSDMSSALSISADGNYIVSGGEATYLFNKSSSIPIWVRPTPHYIRSVRITPDGSYIVAGGWDNFIYFFNRLSSTPLWSCLTGGNIAAVDISDNGDYIVAQSDDDYLYSFNKNSSVPMWIYELDGVSAGSYDYRLDITSDGKYIIAGGRNYLYFFNNTFDPTEPDPDPTDLKIPGYKTLPAFLFVSILLSVVIIYKKLNPVY
jgi:WD40 repeat protein